MYKLGGRGGGRGGGGAAKRPPPPHGRGRGGASSIGGMGAPPRGRAAVSQPAGRDESFRLESSGPPAFAAIIRLTPDLVDEIRRAEEAGGGARIKFNPNMYNSSENVIDVSGKEFKFTWASERGELCDIYEERQSGDDGNGLLLECGSAWRKVNVQRILDESAKNLVKMRSEEAERLSKSRKSIVLDPANPSVKRQAKSMAAAAVEGNMRRMHWKQKEFFKKNQAAVIAPTKSVSKVKLSKSIPKGNFSSSPAPSPEQPGTSIPSFPVGSDANNEVITPFDLNKEENSKTEKSTPSKMPKGINRRASAPSASVDDNTNEVRSLLISVLSENPKGMGLKALENAVADAFPNASKKIESVIENIANYQASGKYVLKPGLEVESSRRHTSEGGRSINENIEEAAPSLKIDDPDIFGRIDIVGSQVAAAGDGKVNNDSEGKAGTSSESGSDSDSDSDSSDSGSDSGSQSKSAAESGSGSSSDSDSDASSSSKEGSDTFVEITSDDGKANTAQTKVADDLNLSSSPRDLTRLDVDDEQIDIGTNLDYRSTSPHIDLNNFNTVNDDAAAEGFGASNLNKPLEIPGSKNTTSTRMDPIGVDSKYNEISYLDNPFDDSLTTISENLPKEEAGQFTKQHGSRRKSASKDGSNHGPMSIADKSAQPKLKRSSGNENSTTKPEIAKKAKVDIASPGATGSFSEHKESLPPEKHTNDRLNKETGSVSRDASRDSNPAMKGRPSVSGNLQKIDESPNVPIPTMHSKRTKENIEKTNSKKKADKMQKPWHGMDGDFGTGYSHGEGHHVNFDGSDDSATRKRSRHGDPLIDDKMLMQLKDANVNVNSMTKTSRGNAGPDEITAFPESNESNGEPSNSQRDNIERSPHGKKKLQRDLSDLELGELPVTSLENDNGRTRKKFERNSYSKSLDGKLTNVNNSYPSMNNRKAPLTVFHDKRKPSPQEYGIGGHINQEGFPRKAAGYDFDDSRPQQRGNVPENQHLSRVDYSDSENILYPDRSGEKTGKRKTRMAHGGMLEYPDMKKKKTTSRLPQNGSNNVIVSRTQKSISPSDNEESSRNALIEIETGRKRRDSFQDEDNLFFSKYDKDEPELKGPIKDFSQYKDYVQEYNEKYEVYSYLNSQMEKTQSEFLRVEEDLNVAKERDKDQYYNILERLRDMYHQSGARHKLMKKVFVLLHEELQTIKQRIKDFAEAYSNE
ncbi:uncharacterized protein LOC133916807 isoform X2 [Phragmites australis]|uniref:uncharacterized protein LOC133916807 isoform X2 n=1 Tax=Phragmites australis TaxID=29695 RepID=UPI002D782F07|nr:uncharacterized protein LOC133916807 isoform X2 [Phragmites australis]